MSFLKLKLNSLQSQKYWNIEAFIYPALLVAVSILDTTSVDEKVNFETIDSLSIWSQINNFVITNLTIILMTTFLLLVIISILIWSHIKYNNRLDDLKKQSNNNQFELNKLIYAQSKSSIISSKDTYKFLEKLSERVDLIEKKISESANFTNDNLKQLEKYLKETSEVLKHREEEKNKREVQSPFYKETEEKVLLFSSVESNSSFNMDKARNYNSENENKVNYKIIFKEGYETGSLEYLSNIRDKTNVDHREDMLKPACELLNSDHHPVNKVEMIKPGTVVKQGNKWVVQNKVQILFK